MKTTISIIACIAALVFVGCSDQLPIEPRTSSSLGARSVPGFDIEVVQLGEAITGKDVSLEVRVESNSENIIRSIALRIGDCYNESADMVVAKDHGNGVYSAHVPVPESADNRVWVVLQQDDGALIECGADDFLLK
jgi:hypothetical protein